MEQFSVCVGVQSASEKRALFDKEVKVVLMSKHLPVRGLAMEKQSSLQSDYLFKTLFKVAIEKTGNTSQKEQHL